MTRYERLEDVIALVRALHTTRRGLTIDDIRERFDVSRRTAERMRDVVARAFPELAFELDPSGRRRWRLPTHAAPRFAMRRSELVALARAAERAQAIGADEEAGLLKDLLARLGGDADPGPPEG